MDGCVGYACPPVNSHMFTPEPYITLASTGSPDMAAHIITAALLLIAGGALFVYNHILGGRNGDDYDREERLPESER